MTRSRTLKPGRPPAARAAQAPAFLLALLVGLSGCAEAPLPESGPRSDECLRGLQLENLQDQIKRCNAVVAAFPDLPGPLNDRYLLRSLAGDDKGACSDIDAAMRLAPARPGSAADRELLEELKLRQRICRAPRRAVSPDPSARSAPAP
jgi:hypothetical protein